MKSIFAQISKYLYIVIPTVLVVAGFFFAFTNLNILNKRLQNIESLFSNVKSDQENLKQNLSEQLFEDHLKVVENIKLNNTIESLQVEIEMLSSSKDNILLTEINSIYTLYKDFQKKLERNNQVKIKTDTLASDVTNWGKFLIEQQFDTLESSISSKNKVLDDEYNKYVASLPPPAPVSGGGYVYTSVNTEMGKFNMYLIKISKSSVTVKTVAAIENDCSRDCSTKTLQQYMQENNAYAGMTGSYACPADYPQCADKKWSFDFALYDSNDRKWLNKDARSWNETGMFTFNSRSSRFYKESSDYGGDSVTAAISNFPSLLEDGDVVVDSGDIDSYQKAKGLRGVIGTDDKNIYLAYISNASVIDAAYAIKAAGARDALNLDGGGTAAMYINGGYVVGPGRPLANAILLIK